MGALVCISQVFFFWENKNPSLPMQFTSLFRDPFESHTAIQTNWTPPNCRRRSGTPPTLTFVVLVTSIYCLNDSCADVIDYFLFFNHFMTFFKTSYNVTIDIL